ncbi:MAG: sugar kinase [Nostocoides sp.]
MTGGLVAVGETLGLVTAGRLPYDRRAHLSFGGAESNVAVGVTRLGGHATWVSRVGRDAIGELIVRELQAEGVCCQVKTCADEPTGVMIKEDLAGGRARVHYHRSGSAASRLQPEDVEDHLLLGASIVHVSGITAALSETARATVLDIAARVAKTPTLLSFDLNFRSRLWDPSTAASFYRTILPLCDIVFAGEDEARILWPTEPTPQGLARSITAHGPAEGIIKLGARGVVATAHGRNYAMPAFPIQVLDTVGAGDAFVAGYLADRLLDADPATCLDTANRAGAVACQSSGDWEGNPTRSELSGLESSEQVLR